MPAPNDLTKEEEAEFAKHGVPSAGPGREPLSEEQQGGGEQQQEQQGGEQQQGGEGQQQGRQTFHRQDGTFASREEREQGQARPSGQQGGEQQGQQQEGEQGQQQEGEQGQQQNQDDRGDLNKALREERQARRELARRTQLAETRLNAILSRQQGGEAPEKMPDIGEDPAGYILAIEQRLQRFEQVNAETTQNQQIDQAINMDEDTFTAMKPDYPQASDYFVQSRAKELLAFHPPQEAQRIMLAEARQIARMAWERGQSVGEAIYSLAQARGYNPGMPQREPFEGQQQGQGQQQGGQQQGQRGPRATDIVESITRGQQSSRSLSSGSGASAESLNATAILDMDDAEFARWLGEGGDATKRFASIG